MTTPERSDVDTVGNKPLNEISTDRRKISLAQQYFQPCSECVTPEACECKKDCFEGYEMMITPGWDFTQEEEDLHNDPRRA